MSKSDDDFDLPEYHADPLPAPAQNVVVIAEDLHLGPAEVKAWGKSWVDEHGPKPPGLGILALDVIIMLMASVVFWIIIVSWQYVFLRN